MRPKGYVKTSYSCCNLENGDHTLTLAYLKGEIWKITADIRSVSVKSATRKPFTFVQKVKDVSPTSVATTNIIARRPRMRWWKIEAECRECKVDGTLVSATFSADSEQAYTFQCPKCHEIFTWRVYASALTHRALVNDLTTDKVNEMCKNVPLRPPLAIAPPTLSEDDAKLLLEMHILPDDGRLM